MGRSSQNYFEGIAAHNFNGRLSISRVIHRNDPLAVQKHLIVAHPVGAATVPVGDCQNTASIRHRIDAKVVRPSTRCIGRTGKEESYVDAGWVTRDLLGVIHGWFLTCKNGGTNKAKENDSKPISSVSISSAAHMADSMSKSVSVPGKSENR